MEFDAYLRHISGAITIAPLISLNYSIHYQTAIAPYIWLNYGKKSRRGRQAPAAFKISKKPILKRFFGGSKTPSAREGWGSLLKDK